MTRRTLLSIALVAAASRPVRAGGGWERVGDEDGIVTDKRVVDGSPVLAWRGSIRIEAPIERVWVVIHDVPARTRWMERCVESRLLAEDAHRQRFYNRTSAPWPAAHRDVVLEARVVVGPDGVRLPFRAVADPGAPPVADVVRMPVLEGAWVLRPVGAAATVVEYEVLADPGGWIPAWIANRIAGTLPIVTLRRLRELAPGARDPAEEASFLARPGLAALLRGR